MTRVALMTLVLAATPVLAAAQTPVPVPAPIRPVAGQLPAPMPAPAAPVAPPMPLPAPAPPMPFDVMPLDMMPPLLPFDFDLDMRSEPMHFDPIDVHVDTIDLSHLDEQMIELREQVEHLARPDVFASAQASTQSARSAQEAAARAAAQADQARMRAFEDQMRSGDAYNAGLNMLQQRQYDRAIQAFDRIIQSKGSRTDAALYWKAFSEFKLARASAALQTISQLQKEHPQSRYLSDAKMLESEARKQSGQSVDPAQLDDDEIKLLAIQGLQRTEQAVPLLEGVLSGANSLNVKKRALYVLALSSDARARDILTRYAKGGGNPDLQLEAVRLLVSRRDPADDRRRAA